MPLIVRTQTRTMPASPELAAALRDLWLRYNANPADTPPDDESALFTELAEKARDDFDLCTDLDAILDRTGAWDFDSLDFDLIG